MTSYGSRALIVRKRGDGNCETYAHVCDRTTQFIQAQVRLSLFNTLTRTYFHLYKPGGPPSVTKDLGKSTSQPRP
jgi:hypothetical protein